MLVLKIIAVVVFQVLALWGAAKAWDHAGRYLPDKTLRNRYAFGALIWSAAALLTAAVA